MCSFFLSTLDTHVYNPFSPHMPSTPLLQGFDVNNELQVTHWAEQWFCCKLNLNARIPSLNQDSHTNITITTLKARTSRIERPTAYWRNLTSQEALLLLGHLQQRSPDRDGDFFDIFESMSQFCRRKNSVQFVPTRWAMSGGAGVWRWGWRWRERERSKWGGTGACVARARDSAAQLGKLASWASRSSGAILFTLVLFWCFSCGPDFEMAIHCITSTHLALKMNFSFGFIELSDENHGGANRGKYWLLRLLGVKDDERVAHLTHVSEIKKKSEALAKTTATLQDVIHNKV